MTVRALLVEDEPLALRSLRRLVEGVDWLDNVGEATDGETAVKLIDELRPDAVFLDVEMPGLSGLDVLSRCEADPEIIFTTAYDRYAVAAFELGAIDYLVKPFGRERFEVAVERLRRRAGADEWPGAKTRALAAFGDGPLRWLFARRRDRIIPVAVADVVRIEAAGEYVSVHAGERSFFLRLPLAELEQRLDPKSFIRVHRSHIVNLGAVVEMRRNDDRRLSIHLADGSTVLASRAGSRLLRELIP
jgi:two-component system LytT family response regulator